jgi:cell division protein YceG involved in septum cleavage
MAGSFSEKNRKYGRKHGFLHGLKLICLLFMLLVLGAVVSLVQAGFEGKKTFYDRLGMIINFANPSQRFVYIYPGMRKEEIAEKYAEVLGWTEKDKRWFIASAPADHENGGFQEGHFLPKAYIVDKDATGKEIGALMTEEFKTTVEEKVLSKQSSAIKSQIDSIIGDDNNATIKSAKSDEDDKDGKNSSKDNKSSGADNSMPKSPADLDLDAAVRIASIIQREAAGPQDMRLISGIIWNRMAKGMSLELDATLQYVKGNEDNWWPVVKSKDKYLDSPYNTYKYKGIPPGAISNPSMDAISAAYNPQKTDCIFYLHDSNRKIHCAKTYEQHLSNIRAYL